MSSTLAAGSTLARQDATALPRLLPADPSRPRSLAEHTARLGPLRLDADRGSLLAEVEASGLTGRGGAAFPTHRKLRAVAAGRNPVVVGNAAEGEPASHKDATLLRLAPHLVLDGMQVAASAVGARTAVLYVHRDPTVERMLAAALDERRRSGRDRVPVTVVGAPHRFLAGEETALASRVSGGPALPRFTPPRVFEQGVDRRPTLVQNVETLAQLALVASYGADWFRAVGDPSQPGTALFSLGGAVERAGVVEAPTGVRLSALFAAAGHTALPQAVLVGGYHGSWLPREAVTDVRMSDEALRPYGARMGAGVVVALPDDACGLVETARVATYLADESARQCGPCLNALPLMATALTELASPSRYSPQLRGRIERWAGLVEGRGACHHPDGTVRFVRSALTTFTAELELHARGRCTGTRRTPVLPTTPPPTRAKDWR